MIVGFVELSGELLPLGEWEVRGAVEALGGVVPSPSPDRAGRVIPVRLPGESDLRALGARLALARRTMVEVAPDRAASDAAREEGTAHRRAAFRRLGRPASTADRAVREAGAAFVHGGGTVDLTDPETRYWLAARPDGSDRLLREVAAVDRGQFARRAMPRLPFRRPVSLPPRLARAAVNLASVTPGSVVLDPFVGTGALLAEAALIGARVYGVDADPAMIRGALANFAHLGVEAQGLVEGDARRVDLPDAPHRFDAIVTDPPYGRSSASRGGAPETLVPEVLGRWQARLAAGGRVVVVTPGGPPVLSGRWVEECRVEARVHRSLTRQFRRYRARA